VTFRDLPHLNAFLNASSALLLFTGWRLVRAGRREAHRRFMTAAMATSGLFLASYLVYHAAAGSVRFPGTGTARTVYLAILVSHSVLAAIVAPLAITIFVLARRGKFETHRKWARITFPIWAYVSVTGVVVYWMLYRVSW
jgi:uncharacterized membrane protein YozB (DUF420 family)